MHRRGIRSRGGLILREHAAGAKAQLAPESHAVSRSALRYDCKRHRPHEAGGLLQNPLSILSLVAQGCVCDPICRLLIWYQFWCLSRRRSVRVVLRRVILSTTQRQDVMIRGGLSKLNDRITAPHQRPSWNFPAFRSYVESMNMQSWCHKYLK